VKPARKRPGRLWLFFYGRQRRGFPGLLVGILAIVLLLGLLFGIPGGAELSRYATLLSVSVIVFLILASLALVVIAAFRRGRR
jgi:hypothetical protein